MLFPPKLNTTCTEGAATVRWANNPENYAVYHLYGPEPGFYYINITCYLQDGSVKQVKLVILVCVWPYSTPFTHMYLFQSTDQWSV